MQVICHTCRNNKKYYYEFKGDSKKLVQSIKKNWGA